MYSVPEEPYVAEITVPDGPKFVPVKVTSVPPDVVIELPPDTPVMLGTKYDSVPAEDALV